LIRDNLKVLVEEGFSGLADLINVVNLFTTDLCCCGYMYVNVVQCVVGPSMQDRNLKLLWRMRNRTSKRWRPNLTRLMYGLFCRYCT